MIIISHYWVINQINKNLTEYKSSRPSIAKKIFDFKSINTENKPTINGRGRMRSNSVEQRILGNKRIFNVLIANKIGINYFFGHLMNEFSVENILFFIEILQWIYDVIDNNWNKYNTSPLGIINFELSNIVPISSINENKNNNWYIKLKQIHKKYIDSSSEYQINLPYYICNGYINLFNLYDIKIGIQNGTFKPKTKRKKHHKNIGALGSKKWRQSIRKSNNNIKNEIKKQIPEMIDINLPKKEIISQRPSTVTTTINMDKFPKKTPTFIMSSNTADNIIINHKKSMIPIVPTALQRHNTFVVHETVDSNSIDSSVAEQENNQQKRDTLAVMNGIFDEVMDEKCDEINIKLPDTNLNVIKTTNSNMFSRISGLFEFSSVIMHKDKDNHIDVGIDREMDIEEKNKMENAKKLSINDFISLSCNATHNILQLNYQSVARFKKTQEWDEFQEQVNWQELLMKYGDKGCIPKKIAKLLS